MIRKRCFFIITDFIIEAKDIMKKIIKFTDKLVFNIKMLFLEKQKVKIIDKDILKC